MQSFLYPDKGLFNFGGHNTIIYNLANCSHLDFSANVLYKKLKCTAAGNAIVAAVKAAMDNLDNFDFMVYSLKVCLLQGGLGNKSQLA